MALEERLGIYFLDVGQGDCSFVIGPGADPVLFDCADAYVAGRFVRDHGIRRLSAAVFSHLDRDHIAGALEFLQDFLSMGGNVAGLHLGIDRQTEGLGQTALELVRHALRWDQQGLIPLVPAQRDAVPRVVCRGADWRVELVLPRYADVVGQRLEGGEQPNRCSAVLRITRGGTAVLIGGDAPLPSWQRLELSLLRASVFRTPHHGGDIAEAGAEWNEHRLYSEVSPEVAVVSVGTHNGYGHPGEAQVGAILAQRSRLVCTQLTSRCHAEPVSRRAQSLANAASVVYPYRHRLFPGDPSRHRPKEEVPCAGAMVAWLDERGQLGFEPPAQSWHEEWVMRLDTPLCQRPFEAPGTCASGPRSSP